MILGRAAVRILKPLWSSAAARFSSLRQNQHIPCGTTITGGDHHRRGFLHRSQSESQDDFDESNYADDVLDSFLGYWQEILDENCMRLLREEGVPQNAINGMTDSQRWLVFFRTGAAWTYGEGKINGHDIHYWNFILGQYYGRIGIDGQQAKGLVVPKSKYFMIDKIQTLNPPYIVIYHQRIVKPKDNIMLVKWTKGDRDAIYKCFKKMPMPDWTKL